MSLAFPPMVSNDTDRELFCQNETIILQSEKKKKKLMKSGILRATRFKHTSREALLFFLPPLLFAQKRAVKILNEVHDGRAQRDLKARVRQNFPIHITRLRLMNVLAQIDMSTIFFNPVFFVIFL